MDFTAQELTAQGLWNEVAAWSERTFGTSAERGPIGPLKHLQKEAQEAAENPEDVSEYADCLILIMDAARRLGLTLDQLVYHGLVKMDINRSRTYHKPVGDAISEHVRD